MIIDADAHFTPFLPSGSKNLNSWMQTYFENKKDHFNHVEARLEELEMLKIDHQTLNPQVHKLGLNYGLSCHLAPEIMQVYNDTMLDIAKDHEQFTVNIWLALQNIPASVKEIERNLDREFFGIFVSEAPPYGFFEELEPIWQICNEHRIPWYMHFNRVDDFLMPAAPQWQPLYQNLLDVLYRRHWLINIASMIIGGVFERYPNLRIVIAERDINWIDYLVRVFDQLRLDNPLPALTSNFWYTIEPEMRGFVDNARRLGWNRLLFATDWPHEYDIGGKNGRFDVSTFQALPIEVEDQERVLCGNFLNLKKRSRLV